MNFKSLKYFILVLIFCTGSAFAQSVRSLNNDGVDEYQKKNFANSEVNFKKELKKIQIIIL